VTANGVLHRHPGHDRVGDVEHSRKKHSCPLLNLPAVRALGSEKQSHPEGIMKGITISKLALAVVSMAIVAHSQTASSESISTWSVQTNTPQWNQDLGVTYTRQGCPDSPASCLSFTGRIASSDKVKVVLAIPLNSTTTAAYARQYSQLSLTSPFLAEISIDDFVDQYRALSTAVPSVNAAAVVAEVIANVKSDNPKLAFGATIYENDLASSLLQNASLPATTREKFDYIHLFLHYRENGPNYSTYVALAKAMFPHAHIIAGSYAVDRRAFLPCAQGGTAECTVQQDFNYFTESLKIQVQELQSGAVDRIEFFPGYFGTESQWTWSDPKHCAATEVDECIANTVAMRDAAIGILNGKVAPPTWLELSPSLFPPVARYGQSAIMDSAHDIMTIFGGSDWTLGLNDTWILAGADGKRGTPAWYQLATVGAPPVGSYSNGMYDPTSDRMIIYGGATGTDVWVLTNANAQSAVKPTWTQLKTAATVENVPSVLTGYEQCTYDPVRNVMMAYDSTAGVWVLTHANGLGGMPTWTLLKTSGTEPSGRSAFTTVYDPTSNRMIVFGGQGGRVDFNDMWALTNANGQSGTPAWIQLKTGTATKPAPRSGHTAVYDPANDAMTIFSGIGQPADTWTATHAIGATQAPVWKLVDNGASGPLPRLNESTVLNTNSSSMIIFGGIDTDIRNTVAVLTPVM
jgi:hypothetical protein